jgi:2',3'-cyclic-nucleotide 2'-phosphodiesterase (5'-nucleotidase family)
LGDLQAFSHHLREEADRRGSDLIFVDAGDQVDGNGFVDADTSGVKGHAARELLKLVGWDLTTPGNHEVR